MVLIIHSSPIDGLVQDCSNSSTLVRRKLLCLSYAAIYNDLTNITAKIYSLIHLLYTACKKNFVTVNDKMVKDFQTLSIVYCANKSLILSDQRKQN